MGDNLLIYRPTSLDFINRPNPVEPLNVLEKHPLGDTPWLDKITDQNRLRLPADNHAADQSTESRNFKDKSTLELPKLPTVSVTSRKRLRIPPTLSGLHHPPPDAGILPSISAEKPRKLTDSAVESGSSTTLQTEPRDHALRSDASVEKESKSSPHLTTNRRKQNKWTDAETNSLLQGVGRFGIGQWTRILNCSDYAFHNRTALDLKDRFRVCCPDEYCSSRRTRRHPEVQASCINEAKGSTASSLEAPGRARKQRKSHQKCSSELRKIGILEPFQKSGRRIKTTYTKVEDEALLHGFQRHGNAWATIQKDDRRLHRRTATDLRDRMRVRYPEEYAKAGLTLKHNTCIKDARDLLPHVQGKDVHVAGSAEEATRAPGAKRSNDDNKPTNDESSESHSATLRKQPSMSFLGLDDVFWSEPFEVNDIDAEPIILDRQILDWPQSSQQVFASSDQITVGSSVNPMATVVLPPPNSTILPLTARPAQETHIHLDVSQRSSAMLPSLPTVIGLPVHSNVTDQIALPSLTSTRLSRVSNVGHSMSLDELVA